jgi:hypothetical protein
VRAGDDRASPQPLEFEPAGEVRRLGAEDYALSAGVIEMEPNCARAVQRDLHQGQRYSGLDIRSHALPSGRRLGGAYLDERFGRVRLVQIPDRAAGFGREPGVPRG